MYYVRIDHSFSNHTPILIKTVWLKNILRELKGSSKNLRLYFDDFSAVANLESPKKYKRRVDDHERKHDFFVFCR